MQNLKVVFRFFVLLFLLSKNTFAQDSLFLERQISNESTNLITENIDLAKLNSYNVSFFQINKRRNLIGNKTNNQNLVAQTATNLATYYFQQNDFKNAQQYLEQAMQAQNVLGNGKSLALLNARLAFVYERLNMDDRALELYKQSIKNFQHYKLDKQLAEANYLISKLYVKINKADEAETFLKSGIEASQTGNTKALGNKMSNLL
ncbi:MAG: MalT-like region, partial [Bacteroidota bacterium]